MSRGFVSGIVAGVAVSALGLGVLSLMVPRPQRAPVTPPPAEAPAEPVAEAPVEAPALEPAPAPDAAPQPPEETPAVPAGAPPATGGVELPPGSEFNRPRPEGEARLPGTDTQPEAAPAPEVSPPEPAEITAAPQPDTTPAAAPEAVAETPAPIAPPAAGEEAPALVPGEAQPVLPSPAALGPEAPEAEAAPAAPPAPEPQLPPVPEPEAAPEVEPSEGGERGEAAPAAAPEETGEAAARTPAGMIGEAPEAIRVPVPGGGIARPDVTTGRLPSIGAAEAPGPAAEDRAALGALARYAVPFTPEPGKPLFSVILIDAGEEGLDRAALTTFSFPVTFAVDASRPDAREAMEAYRAAGYEVVLLARSLAAEATPEELTASVTAALRDVPEAVAVMEGANGGFQANRPALQALAGLLGESGHGVVTFDKALNTAAQVARSAGVPAATIFRRLDAGHEAAPVIGRYLDRAVFKAAQDGHVVMVGHSYPQTVTALFSWAIEGKGAEVNLAPISAILRAN